MQLSEIQKFCKELLSRVIYPRVGAIIGLQEEIGKLAEIIMDVEIYGKFFDRNKLEERCSGVFFSFIDLCNLYDIEIDKISKFRIKKIRKKIEKWEKEHEKILQEKREKFD